MKLKNNFLIRETGSEAVLVPVGRIGFKGIIRLNNTAAFIVRQLQGKDLTEEGLLAQVLEKYDVSRETALADVEKVVKTLRSVGALEE